MSDFQLRIGEYSIRRSSNPFPKNPHTITQAADGKGVATESRFVMMSNGDIFVIERRFPVEMKAVVEAGKK